MNLRFVEGLMLRQTQHERQNWRVSTRPSTSSGRTEVALWLASDRSAYTTGCVITVGGGHEGFPR